MNSTVATMSMFKFMSRGPTEQAEAGTGPASPSKAVAGRRAETDKIVMTQMDGGEKKWDYTYTWYQVRGSQQGTIGVHMWHSQHPSLKGRLWWGGLWGGGGGGGGGGWGARGMGGCSRRQGTGRGIGGGQMPGEHPCRDKHRSKADC